MCLYTLATYQVCGLAWLPLPSQVRHQASLPGDILRTLWKALLDGAPQACIPLLEFMHALSEILSYKSYTHTHTFLKGRGSRQTVFHP